MSHSKIKSLLSCFMIMSLSCNFAFAEVVSIKNPASAGTPTSTTSKDKIDIVKAQTTTTTTKTTTTISAFSGNYYDTGIPDNGSKGVTIAAAYLTPDKQFGYMYVDTYDYDGRGTVKAYRDPISSSAGRALWGGNVDGGSGTSNNRLYNNAISYFKSANGPINSIKGVTAANYDNGLYNIQTDDDGRKFVASTLYVRYTYDIADGHDNGNSYRKSSPVLSSSYTSGPYIAMGDYFDAKYDVIGDSTARSKITNGGSKYFKSLSSLGYNAPAGVIGLTIDDGFIPPYQRTTSRAMLEKRYEYRRYITSKTETVTTTIDNPGQYEVVYPVTETTTKTQVVIPDTSPKVSIKSKTEYTDSTKKEISRYVFDVNITTKQASNTYGGRKTYTVRKASDVPSNEPAENKMDVWHSDVVAYIDIIDSNGNSRLYNKKFINLSDKKVYVYPDEIKPVNGSYSIHGCTAKLIVDFKNNARYMSKKDTYKYLYLQGSEKKTYSQVISYIETKDTGLQIKTDINNHYNSTDPRDVLTYETTTTRTNTIMASAGISAVTRGDYAKVKMNVKVDPPNALTVLEGGVFNIDMDVNSGSIPIGFNGQDVWISDFMIDEILVTSANGDTIHREVSIPINPATSTTTIKKKISNLTAKPTHIGKATVTVKYSYNINTQTYRVEPIPDSGVVQPDGTIVYEYTTVKDVVDVQPQNGVAYDYFNIYSLTGTTVVA